MGRPVASANRVSILQRLKSPAPKHEDTGLGVFLALGPLTALFFVVEGLRATDVTQVVAGGGIAALVALSLVRKVWSFWVLFWGLWALWSFYVWVASLLPRGSPGQGGAVGWAIASCLFIFYFWRRRWWYGAEVPAEVPDRSPQSWNWVQFVVAALVFTALVSGFLNACRRMGAFSS